jgi:hypothetical protein
MNVILLNLNQLMGFVIVNVPPAGFRNQKQNACATMKKV